VRKAQFGSPRSELRERLVAAILRGEKTASAALLIDYEREGEDLPQVGRRSLVVDNDDRGVGVIELTEVRVLRVADCDLAFARDEGEGFESVAEWRDAHESFRGSSADEIRHYLGDPGWTVTDETAFVAQRFRLVEAL
jgi:uncharacterized protein YhfF